MRKKRAEIREIPPDPVYNSVRVAKFINKLMWDGKKTIAEKIFYTALKKIEERTKKDGLEVFNKAIDNLKPLYEVRPRRVGGATYQVPVEVDERRGETLAMRWIIQVAREEKGRRMVDKLVDEIIEAYNGSGKAMKIKENVHRMAEANRAFAHFKW
ncbi:MAG: 30S ribosomal protein S7 [Candidatus Calescibacterium sp.]|nr:30S ribosomal protein S7 [Candidatus Calescibacterium sp.]MCX7972242.1 30S ribosomal protein S7 [bacterium]MDW8195157.1 30S ribosomal protein S7 [Candidatus Calescibacterium sp.]